MNFEENVDMKFKKSFLFSITEETIEYFRLMFFIGKNSSIFKLFVKFSVDSLFSDNNEMLFK